MPQNDSLRTSLNQRLLEASKPFLEGKRILDFVFGLGLTAVRLSDGGIGCALMMVEELKGFICRNEYRQWIGAPAEELVATLVEEIPFLQRSLAVAALNAASPTEGLKGGEHLDASKTAFCDPGDRVAMIGYIPSLTETLRREAGEVYVFDNARTGEEGILPRERQEELLPNCRRIWATGSTVVNNTADSIFKLCPNAVAFTLVGPSTPNYPKAFSAAPVTALEGCRWHKWRHREIFSRTAQGAGIVHLSEFMDKVHLGVDHGE